MAERRSWSIKGKPKNEIDEFQKVTNFEQDFASGYLFGELLYKFNQ